MKEQPYFSIVIPVYNVEKYIKNCINTILMQTFADYEILLVDDGSTDKDTILEVEKGRPFWIKDYYID